jgi:acyl carrier protein
MTREEVRQAIIDIIKSITPDEDISNIDGERPLREQLGLDSMDFLDIVMEIRKRYNIDVPENDYMELVSLDSSTNYLAPKLETFN